MSIEIAEQVKERPMLFSGQMVQAILAGRKTQTRRIVKPPPHDGWLPEVGLYCPTLIDKDGEAYPGDEVYGASDEYASRVSPYGRPGDHIWVKETHLIRGAGTVVDYRANFDRIDAAGHGAMYGRWKPSIFMRREHSRITLEVTDVRVQRLQDISEADARAEGLFHNLTWNRWAPTAEMDERGHRFPDAKTAFHILWESINGPGSWEVNPFVWAITFNRIKP